MNGTGTCRHESCRAPLLWRANIATGKRVPLDAAPVESDARLISSPKWHYVLIDRETCRSVTPAEWADHDIPVFVSHWRTCPAASWFSERGKRDG